MFLVHDKKRMLGLLGEATSGLTVAATRREIWRALGILGVLVPEL